MYNRSNAKKNTPCLMTHKKIECACSSKNETKKWLSEEKWAQTSRTQAELNGAQDSVKMMRSMRVALWFT